ncbi:MAG: B12-binding domain-containing radical SAM protein [Deltaproteobacteria bacterium]
MEDRIHADEISVPPMGIYYVGAMLKAHGYPVEILNWHAIHKTEHLIAETLKKAKPDIIGFSILHANRWGGIDIARKAKALNPKVKIVFGGIGATFLWRHLMTHFAEIDFVVLGEGEFAFLDLVKAIEKEDDSHIGEIKGIAFRQGPELKSIEPAPRLRDLDKLPMPAQYFTYSHVAFTRGCPGNCAFCGSPLFWGQKVRTHSPGYFVDQLEMLNQKGVKQFYFSDDTFTFHASAVIAICREIIGRKLDITWVAISRVNYISEELLAWMRRAGCTQISFGVESGSEAVRKRLNKKINTEQVKKAFSLTQKFGIMARAYFIYGSPGETHETIQATMDLIHAIKPLSAIFYILDLFPGTQLYAEFMERLGLTDDIWLERVEDILYFEKDPLLTREMVLAFGKQLREDFYQHLPEFVDHVELIQDPAFDRLHADFYSRLAMTFSHGDYAHLETINSPQTIAEKLHKKALQFHKDHRAFLGLGMLFQEQRNLEDAKNIVDRGLAEFPDSFDLILCQAINHMNSNDYKAALALLEPHKEQKTARTYMAHCREAIGNMKA